ncbi:VRR-NUC domain-containing protein [Pasteurella atlantica]|uniref:VRR-NUC domain-containing protein n=2 Tax=Pasteurellaceae TaxID=712 RepID=A0ACC6HJI3_9PAST|nr:VRR-NUC domain-containing protein [Pasteurella atlantica]MDP8051016.1 VRR-NUC domain-containing protein [Pasteurella atlantica]MDP8104312.1 VRR-NUC domain-containing protein [Pasteurella atlantica]MDP8147672.1 VRR-NUC domain-containing protein [Pasteurella atlantica]
MLREKDIEKNLVDEVKKRGGIAYKFISPGRANVPDRIVVLPNSRLIFVECKAPKQKPRAGQIREIERLRALGHRVEIIDSYEVDHLWQD